MVYGVFCKDPESIGETNGWAKNPPEACIPMPVPAAFNEMTSDPQLRDYFGLVWYFKELPVLPFGESKILRLGAATYRCKIFVNGKLLQSIEGGRLPIEIDLTDYLIDEHCLLAICIDTRLNWQSIPPGTQKTMAPTWSTPNLHGNNEPRPEYHFDFLNYGGLLRSVWLLGLPKNRILTIQMQTITELGKPIGIRPIVKTSGNSAITCKLFDTDNNCVAEGDTLCPENAHVWSPEKPYLYTLEIQIENGDIYRQKTGLRSVEVTKDHLLLNGEPIYLKRSRTA